ncbi:hypothetical protein VaNZ11_007542 [Volvox africanus]|uniref:Pherophorin domain-containing protein n=1 Tax=Volvox africanus TaxID=51714 RepID=A0ABQ5S344_9CHLO|nr:hypothetical protein VaNZ11_007542 [Volvox africanus]
MLAPASVRGATVPAPTVGLQPPTKQYVVVQDDVCANASIGGPAPAGCVPPEGASLRVGLRIHYEASHNLHGNSASAADNYEFWSCPPSWLKFSCCGDGS